MTERVDWVDVAKGICIIMVVMMHSTLGVEKAAGATGWMGYARRIRAPVPHAGLLPDRRPLPREPHQRAVAALSRPQGAALRLFLRAVADHPVRLQGAGLAGRDRLGRRRCANISSPSSSPGARSGSSTTWRSSCVVTRLLKNVPWLIVWLGAAALEIAPIHTGSVLIDEFAGRFVYFYSGYVFATYVFRARRGGCRRPWHRADRPRALGGAERASWSSTATATCRSSAWRSDFAGALAVVTGATLIAQTPRRRPRSAGSASIRS